MLEARSLYDARVQQLKSELTSLDRAGSRLANLRTVSFLALVTFIFLVGFDKMPRWGLLLALVSFAAYVALAVVHARVIRREDLAKVRLSLSERGLLRLQGRWHTFESRGDLKQVPAEHLYASDLDVVGQGSLFQLLDETGTAAGGRQLLDWLLVPAPNAATVKQRQEATQELAPQIDFRQTLVAEARVAGKKEKADPSRFIAWAEAAPSLEAIRWAWPVAHVLPVFTLTAGALAAADVWSAAPCWAGILIQAGIVFATRKPLNALWEALSMGERGFVRFEETFHAIDHQQFQGAYLTSLQQGLISGPPVSIRLRHFARLMGFAELKHSGQMHPLINVLTLWDLLVLFRIERWRVNHGHGVRKWFEALAELEALSSFATYHFEHPGDAFPEVTDEAVQLEAKALGHPLLDEPVCNDVALKAPGAAFIITGSNMSGKTTLMRALGLNVVMAAAGLPVRAASMRVSVMHVLTSMRVKDSLERGVSYFYAEVQRVKAVIEQAQAHPNHCLFLLDELFMGTNARERQIASRAVVLMLVNSGAAGAVTTHDLSLCQLADERPTLIENVHFRDEVRDGAMTFDYRLRPGVVTTTNALEVLRRAGVPISNEKTS